MLAHQTARTYVSVTRKGPGFIYFKQHVFVCVLTFNKGFRVTVTMKVIVVLIQASNWAIG